MAWKMLRTHKLEKSKKASVTAAKSQVSSGAGPGGQGPGHEGKKGHNGELRFYVMGNGKLWEAPE